MKKFLIVISVILLVVIVATMTVGCKKNAIVIEPLDIAAGARPDVASAITSQELALINAGLAANATDGQKKIAALALFDIGDRTRRSADILLTISDGSGYAKTGAEGYMTVRGFYFKYGNAYYSQNAGQVTSAKVGAVIPDATNVGRNMLDQLNRVYTDDMQTFYQSKAKSGKEADRPDVAAYDHFPYVSANFGKCDNKEFDLEGYMVEARLLEAPGELANFAFSPDSIRNAVVVYNEEEGFYRVNFELDVDKKGTEAYEDTVKFARDGLREASTSDNLEYVVYNVTMEVWNNGYIRTYSSVENWEATLKISFLNVEGVSDSENMVSYYWTWEEIKEVIEVYEPYAEIETPTAFLAALKPTWIN